MTNPVLESVRETFLSTKNLADRALAQLDDEQLHASLVADGNSVATIVRHVGGNLHSRWTDFLTSDGEKPWRNRDEEFDERTLSRENLLQDWDSGWACLFATLEGLNDGDLEKVVQIRAEDLTVIRALDRQIAHYSYHIGQIVLIARTLRAEKWISLSIARGKSADFNRELFGERGA